MDLKHYTRQIEQGLRSLPLSVDAAIPSLYEPIVYTLDGGGKRLRPVLTLMAAEALGADSASALNAALGIEVFHNFTLLHDDVMDRSDLRRGRPTVHARWDQNTAILSGDAMLTLATQLVAQVPDTALRPVLQAFNQGAMDVYEGQALDMDFERRDTVTIPEYIRMITLKTGALLATALKVGAIIGGADTERLEALYDFGIDLGIAFQIHDDYLDMYGNEERLGKPVGGDVQNNKQTYLLLTAFAHGGKEASALRQAMHMERGERKLAIFRRIYDDLGIADQCRQATVRYCNSAISALHRACLDPDQEARFAALANRLTDRDK
ncbi:MAG: polyprenyl synthetase family protein [Lepagella sp.]